MKVTRRKFLQTLGAGAVVGGASAYGAGRHAEAAPQGPGCFKKNAPDQQNSLFDKLPTCCIREPLDKGEMRITFLGTSCTPMLTQQGVSVYVEVGPTGRSMACRWITPCSTVAWAASPITSPRAYRISGWIRSSSLICMRIT